MTKGARKELLLLLQKYVSCDKKLDKRLAIYPDAMDIKRIASIIGYADSTLRKHVRKGRLFAMMQDHKYLVSKYSLIKFLSSDKGLAMQPKSEWHEKAIRWFVEVMNK